MPIVARLMKRRTKMDKKAVSTAPSALPVVGTEITECDVHNGLHKKQAGTYGGKAAYSDGDGGAICLARRGAAWRLVEAWPR